MPRPRFIGQRLVPADFPGRAVERAGPVAVGGRVVRDERFAVRRHVAAADFERVEAERRRGGVQLRFDRPRRLRRAEAAERRARRRMRQQRARGDARMRRPIRSACRIAGLADDADADVGVGADQEVGVDVLKDDPPVAIEPRAHVGRAPTSGAPPEMSPRASAPVAPAGRCEARGYAISGSNFGHPFPPKPPPGSGEMMRTRDTGQPSADATTRCSTYGCWIGLQTVTPSGSGAAMKACGSIAKCVTIGNV